MTPNFSRAIKDHTPFDWTDLFPELVPLRRAEPVERYEGARDWFCTPEGGRALEGWARHVAEQPGLLALAASLKAAADGNASERDFFARLFARDLGEIYDWRRREAAQQAAELAGRLEGART